MQLVIKKTAQTNPAVKAASLVLLIDSPLLPESLSVYMGTLHYTIFETIVNLFCVKLPC